MSRRQVFRILHVVWALPCLAASIFLASATEGHPPGIVFVPLVAVVWALGHLALWGSHRLLRSGTARVERLGRRPVWPPGVLLALVGCGVMSFLGVLFLGRIGFGHQLTRPWNLLMLGAFAVHVPCFVGLLLRRSWARILAVVVAAGWSFVMILQIIDHLWRQSPIKPWELVVALGWISGFGFLAWHLATSRQVRAYFSGISND